MKGTILKYLLKNLQQKKKYCKLTSFHERKENGKEIASIWSVYNGTKEIYVACGELMGKNVEESLFYPAIIFPLYLKGNSCKTKKKINLFKAENGILFLELNFFSFFLSCVSQF